MKSKAHHFSHLQSLIFSLTGRINYNFKAQLQHTLTSRSLDLFYNECLHSNVTMTTDEKINSPLISYCHPDRNGGGANSVNTKHAHDSLCIPGNLQCPKEEEITKDAITIKNDRCYRHRTDSLHPQGRIPGNQSPKEEEQYNAIACYRTQSNEQVGRKAQLQLIITITCLPVFALVS